MGSVGASSAEVERNGAVSVSTIGSGLFKQSFFSKGAVGRRFFSTPGLSPKSPCQVSRSQTAAPRTCRRAELVRSALPCWRSISRSLRAVSPHFAMEPLRSVRSEKRRARRIAVCSPELAADFGWPSWWGSPELEVESRSETCFAALLIDRSRALVQESQTGTLGWSQSIRYARACAVKAGLGFAAGSGSLRRVAKPCARLPLRAGRLERA